MRHPAARPRRCRVDEEPHGRNATEPATSATRQPRLSSKVNARIVTCRAFTLQRRTSVSRYQASCPPDEGRIEPDSGNYRLDDNGGEFPCGGFHVAADSSSNRMTGM